MAKKGPEMPYISGEPEGLERRKRAEDVEEEERLRGGPYRSADLRTGKDELPEKKNLSTGGKREVSLEDLPDELSASELDPGQTLELNEAIRHGYADISQNPREKIEKEPSRTPEELARQIAEKEAEARRNKRPRK